MSTRAAPLRATSRACEAPAGFEQVESALHRTHVAVATQYRECDPGRPGADPLRQRVVAAPGGHPGTQRAGQERPGREPLAEFDEQQCLVVEGPA